MFSKNVIVSYARTPIGSFGGSLKNISSIDLATMTVRAALERGNIPPEAIDEVILGCVGQYGRNAFIARLASLQAGIPYTATAQTVNRMCASGLQAVVTAAEMIELGDVEAVVAGGAESMSNYPYLLADVRFGLRMGVLGDTMQDALLAALCEPTTGIHQHIAITAENIAQKYCLTREELDEYSLQSQERARKAISNGLFTEEIIPVEIKERKKTFTFDTDEHPRETSMNQLAKLRSIVRPDGLVTAGNASGVNDAGAALTIMSEEKAKEIGAIPVARLVDYACGGVDPMYMGLGPIESTKKLLKKTGMRLSDFGVVELNEAFASQAIACIRELGLDPSLVNPNGSGISLGHPIGATGTIITIKLLQEMRRRGIRYGLATLCIGGGQGLSAAFELL